MCIIFMIMNVVISKKRGYKPLRTEKIKPAEFFDALKVAILPLMLPIIIIGGIRLGIFTATEAGSVAIVYALVLGLLYREMKWKEVIIGLRETVATTASIMLIVTGASAFAWILTRERIPQAFTQVVLGAISSRPIFLIVTIIFLIFVGMFIEGNAALIVLVPLLHPVGVAYGLDPIHFAMVYIFTMAIGGVTPPMGTLIFVTCGVTKCKIKDFIIEAIPFYIVLFIAMLAVAFVPFISTGLVNLIY